MHIAPSSTIFITIWQHAYLQKVQGYFQHPKRLLPTPEAMCCWGRTWHKALCFQYWSRGYCFLKWTWIICLSLFCHWLPSMEGLQNPWGSKKTLAQQENLDWLCTHKFSIKSTTIPMWSQTPYPAWGTSAQYPSMYSIFALCSTVQASIHLGSSSQNGTQAKSLSWSSCVLCHVRPSLPHLMAFSRTNLKMVQNIPLKKKHKLESA